MCGAFGWLGGGGGGGKGDLIYKFINQPEDGPQVGPKHVVVFLYVLIHKYSCV